MVGESIVFVFGIGWCFCLRLFLVVGSLQNDGIMQEERERECFDTLII